MLGLATVAAVGGSLASRMSRERVRSTCRDGVPESIAITTIESVLLVSKSKMPERASDKSPVFGFTENRVSLLGRENRMLWLVSLSVALSLLNGTPTS